jgi:hypothetical protein
LAQRVIELADGDPTKGALLMGSPLAVATAMRGLTRLCLGINGWRSDVDAAISMASPLHPTSYVTAIMYKYIVAIPIGALPADTVAMRETADALRIAEQVGDDFTLRLAQLTRGLALVRHLGSQREEGFNLLTKARDAALKEGFTMNALAVVDPEIAREKARNGDLDGAIELSRAVIDGMFDTGAMFLHGLPLRSWWNRCLIAVPSPTCKKHRLPSTGWRLCPPTPASHCTNSPCCGCGLYWRGLTAMPRLTRTPGIATATWRERLASRGISSGPRRCHNGGRSAPL